MKGLVKMNEAVHSIVKDWLVLMLAGIGISFPPHHYVGGLLLAMAGAAVAAHMQPEQDRREMWLVIVTAWLVATIVAAVMVSRQPEFPPQIAMAVSGFLSRYIARFALAMAGMVEQRTNTIFDRILERFFPGKDDK